jgi:hypothetical protein
MTFYNLCLDEDCKSNTQSPRGHRALAAGWRKSIAPPTRQKSAAHDAGLAFDRATAPPTTTGRVYPRLIVDVTTFAADRATPARADRSTQSPFVLTGHNGVAVRTRTITPIE